MKNKVLFVGGYRLPDKTASAIRLKGLVYLVHMMGYEPLVFGKWDDGHQSEGLLYGLKVRSYDITKGKNGKRYDFAKDIGGLEDRIQDILPSIKTIIVYNYAPIAFNKLLKMCKKQNIALIADVTEWYGIDGAFTISKVYRKLLNEWRMRVLNKKAKGLIVASKMMQNYYEYRPTVIIPFASEVENEERDFMPVEEKETTRFLYVGSPGLNFSKDRLDVLLECFAKVNLNFYFTIVGIDQETLISFKPSLKNTIDSLILKKKLEIKGRVPHFEVPKYFEDSHFTVFLRDKKRSSDAGFATKIYEAFKYGIPCITNDTSDNKEYIRTEENGFIISSLDTNEILMCLRKAIELDKEAYNQMKHSCFMSNPFYLENFKVPFEKLLMQLNL